MPTTITTTPSSGRKRISDEEMRKLRTKGNRKVKGIFRCYEPLGGQFKFSFKKYPGDAVETYIMNDGETYSIPMRVAQHLNNNCAYPRHAHILDANGNPVLDTTKKVNRCSFESLEFTMDE